MINGEILKYVNGDCSHTCTELRLNNIGEKVTLVGSVQAIRQFGGLTFIDLKDLQGVTQLIFDMEDNPSLCLRADEMNKNQLIEITGHVQKRPLKSLRYDTGDIEIRVTILSIFL